ncbi:MAG TPA: hypothetical protein VMF69_24215 [Gemmataceae bacterium]|nr:hypothetical protein [Gemmataceae bacterium]
MSQTAPPSDKTDKRASSKLAPPDERFWQRYSPHAELPLSGAGSLVFHLLVFGLLGLMAWLGVALFGHASRSLPVEAVRIAPGGGGNPQGQGNGPNNDAPVEAGDQNKEGASETNPPPEDAPPTINVDPNTEKKQQFDDPAGRRIQQSDEASKVFSSLRKQAGRIQSSSEPGQGRGGPGSGGGKGTGQGPGTGSGRGDGPPANLTQREKRQLRWSMLFNTRDSSDYVAQLQGLGAILAIPVRDRGDDFDYMFIRHLSDRPAKLVAGDIQGVLQEVNAMVRWFDKEPRNVVGVLSVLRIPLPKIPQDQLHFVACMPEKLEKKLLRLELDYLNKRHPGRSEDDIEETRFKVRVRNGQYEPEVYEQKLK